MFCVYHGNWSMKAKCLQWVGRCLGWNRNTDRRVESFERRISEYPLETSELWCNHGNWQGKLEYAPRWHYGQGKVASFEGLSVRIPASYHEYLTQKYGDYTKELKDEEKIGHHFYAVCDCNQPYTAYTKKKEGRP